jgi:hypothetical protein
MKANNRKEAPIRTTLFHMTPSNMVYENNNGNYIARPETEEEMVKRISRKMEEENAFNSYRFNPETVNYSLN